MICPHCFETIDDDVTVCPHCHASVDGETPHPRLVFCEGCGARLSPHDRTCPKCGRPAPGILSTAASASDLAAGKTASFPRLTQAAIETELPHPEPVTAQSVLEDSLDASATSVLDRSELEERAGGSKKRKREIDPYHERKRPIKAIIIAVVVLVLVGCGAAFVTLDPLGVMPGFYAYVQQSAQEMFPSREGMGTTTPDDATNDADASDNTDGDDSSDDTEPLQDEALSDDAAYEQLTKAYNTIVDINGGERFQDAIDSFNGSYLLSSYSARKQASLGAYALRDELATLVDDLDNMKLADGSAYTEDREHVKQLAEWMYERINVICESWDISLSYSDGENLSSHQNEILKPMRAAGNTARDNYYDHVYDWEPVEK